MQELSPHDDFIHPIGQEPAWREAFYFDFFDPASRLSAFGYSGVHPNLGIGDVIFALWREDVLLTRFTRWDFNIPADLGAERLGFGPLFFEPTQPWKQWKMFYDDGACRVDVTFDAIHSPYSWGHSHGALAETNSHHYEQQGRYSGTVIAAGVPYTIHGVGVRDHAWGWGARAGIRRWVWASAQFSPQFAWNTFQITLGDGREVLYGYVFRAGENTLLRRSQLSANYPARGRAPESLAVELESRAGERLSATGRILTAFNTSFQERNKTGYHYFCATEYLCQGQTGYGQSNFHWRSDGDRPQQWNVETAKE